MVSESLYAGIDPSKQSANSQTAYKWSFASKRTRAEDEAQQAARAEVGAATYREPSSRSGDGSNKRVQGPSLPPQADRVLAREAAEERAAAERGYQRKRDKAEARDRVEDMVGPREVGRERMLEKKRERREGDRAFREKGDEGLEIDEGTLLGGGDSFKAEWVLPLIVCFPFPWLLTNTHTRRPCFDYAELLAGMPRVRGSSRNVRPHARRKYWHPAIVYLLSVKRTRQLWICLCRWPRRGMGDYPAPCMSWRYPQCTQFNWWVSSGSI